MKNQRLGWSWGTNPTVAGLAQQRFRDLMINIQRSARLNFLKTRMEVENMWFTE